MAGVVLLALLVAGFYFGLWRTGLFSKYAMWWARHRFIGTIIQGAIIFVLSFLVVVLMFGDGTVALIGAVLLTLGLAGGQSQFIQGMRRGAAERGERSEL